MNAFCEFDSRVSPFPSRVSPCPRRYLQAPYLSIYLSIYLSLSLSLSLYIYLYIYIYMYICMYVCMYVYVYVSIYPLRSRRVWRPGRERDTARTSTAPHQPWRLVPSRICFRISGFRLMGVFIMPFVQVEGCTYPTLQFMGVLIKNLRPPRLRVGVEVHPACAARFFGPQALRFGSNLRVTFP